MFWRFVHSAGGDFETLLSRDPPPSIEELLDDDEFLTECKTQNAKLVDILSRPEAVRALMGWVVVGLKPQEERETETEEDKKRRTRFPSIATEVLSSEVWAIVETSLNPSYDLMKPFWESVLGPVPSQQSLTLTSPPATTNNGPEDMDIDLFPPVPSDSAPPPPSSSASPSSESTPLSPSPTSTAEEITVETGDDDDEFEGEPGSTAKEERHADFHKVLLEEMAAAAEDGKEVAYGLWGRVNAVFLGKKTAEMLSFIRAQPFIVERLLQKIDSPAVVDLLFRIIQCEEMPAGQGVIDWLSSESIIPRLTTLLSPDFYPSHHDTATDLLKGIITMSAPAPGPFNPHSGSNEGGGSDGGGGLGGMRNNKFARELVAEDTVERLVGYMLDEPGLLATGDRLVDPSLGTPLPSSPAPKPIDPSLASLAATSSLTSSIAVFIELIRKNNSDYSEPHLFHTLRNGLMAKSSQVAAAAAAASRAEGGGVVDTEQKDIEDRKEMEEAMEVINNKMGIVHLGSLLTVLSARLGSFQELVKSPRTKLEIDSSPASPPPLTLERFRIVELYAELLHCSNMAILNRAYGTGPTYDDDGRLLGGLSGLDELSAALAGAEADSDEKANEEDVVLQDSKGLPVSSASSTDASSSSDESEDGEMEDVSVEDPPAAPIVEITKATSPPGPTPSASAPPTLNLPPSSSNESTSISAAPSDIASVSRHAVHATTAAQSVASESSAPALGGAGDLPPGDLLKQKFIDHGLLITLFDLFFTFPLNNFLHNVVYDIFQQVLTGRLDQGLNRELVIVLFRDGNLVEKILHGQRLNDSMQHRLGFMGHLILIAEDTIKFLARCPPDLLTVVSSTFNQSEWNAFVAGPYQAAKERDNTVMGGGKPRNSSLSMADESSPGTAATDSDSDEDEDDEDGGSGGMTGTSRLASLSSGFGFGPASSGEDGDLGATTEQFSRYLAQQMSSGPSDRHFESSSDDDDDDDADWIADSTHFDTSNSGASSSRQSNAFSDNRRAHASVNVFEDKMGEGSSSWVDDDDAWGTFQSTATTTTSSSSDDPFGDDFAAFPSSSSPSSTNPHSEALAALEWNDASFSQEFKDVDSDDDVSTSFNTSSFSSTAPFSSSSSARIAIPSWTEEDDDEADGPSTPTGKPSSSAWGAFTEADPSSSTSPSTSPINTSHLSSSPSTQNLSMHATNLSLSTSPVSPFLFGGAAATIFTPMSAISPPDPSLLATVNDDEPLGPGVGSDVSTGENEEGAKTLEKVGVDGEVISVPMDEIALAVEADLQKKQADEREAEQREKDARSG